MGLLLALPALVLVLAGGCVEDADTSQPLAAPQLVSVQPALGPSEGGIPITLKGDNFAPGATVTFAGLMATDVQVMSRTQLVATLPKRLGAFGVVDVQVTNPNNKSGGGPLFSYFLSNLSFMVPSIVATSGTALVTRDINNDGRPDLILSFVDSIGMPPMTVMTPISVVSLLGRGDGSFGMPQTFAANGMGGTMSASSYLDVADFNGDQKLDVVVANSGSNNVSVLLGNGDGTFKAAQTSAVGTAPRFVVAADFNGDQKLDVAVANSGSNNVSVLLGNGDGTFAPQRTIPGVNGAFALIAADLNGDQKLDLAANNGYDMISILLGRGDGSFQMGASYSGFINPLSLVAADFNGDQKPDLAVGNIQSTTISLLFGNGDGSFQTPHTIDVDSGPFSLVAVDFNGDEKLDLAYTNFYSGSCAVMLQRPDGTFQAPKNTPLGNSPNFTVVADFNGDRKLDLAVSSNRKQGGVAVLLNNSQ